MPLANTQTGPRVVPTFDTLRNTAQQLVTTWRAARVRRSRYRTTFAELSGQSDRELADIGITRGDIHRIAAEHLEKGTDQ